MIPAAPVIREGIRPVQRRPMRARALHTFAGAFALTCVLLQTAPASAQSITLPPPPPNTPVMSYDNTFVSIPAGTFDVGSNFLRHLGNQATYGFHAASRANPNGGGAPAADAYPKWRTWIEGYATRSRQDAQGLFVGDRRRTTGGIAGLSATVWEGVTFGVSVDQSRTMIDVPLAAQSATLDMTQVGFNAAFERGPWTAALAVVRGFADIDARRLDGATFAMANYDARLTGALGEISYYHGIGQARIVPKASLEYLQIRTDAFAETGGTNPVVGSGQSASRTRLYLGAEVGHYWIVERTIFDLSAYGKFVDNLHQDAGAINVAFASGVGAPITVQGVTESRHGVNTGATFSVSFSQMVRAYLAYDGKFREGFASHTGTAGLDIRW